MNIVGIVLISNVQRSAAMMREYNRPLRRVAKIFLLLLLTDLLRIGT